MATQTVSFEYDPGRNILFTADDYEVRTREDADAFCAIYQRQFAALGRKVNVVSRIDGLYINTAVSEYYGQKARELSAAHVLNFARYGENPTARMTVRTASLRARFETNIYDTRDQAVAAIEQMKQRAG